jgi:hypothetical protein
MSVKQTFLLQIDNFLEEIKNISNENKEIMVFCEQYNMLKSINSKLIVEYFIKFVYPFNKQIREKDDNFFLQGGGQEELNDKSGLKLRDTLLNLWNNNLDPDKKEIIWKYLLVFCLLGEKYVLENANK